MPHMEGRGEADAFSAEDKVPKTNAPAMQSNRPVDIRQLRHSLNRARTWLQMSTRDIPWSQAQEYDRLEQVLLTRLRRLHKIDHSFISQVTVAELEAALKAKTLTHDRARIAKWKSDMQQLGMACQYVRGTTPQRAPMLIDADGNQAAGYEAMNASLTRYWQQVAHPKHTTLENVSQYVRKRVDDLPRAPEVALQPFTADALTRLCARLRKKTAPGPGGWRAGELAQLPKEAMAELAQMMNLVIDTGHTPKLWQVSWTSFLPKQQSHLISSQRPITVTALTWRIFARHVYNSIYPAVDPQLHPAQCGARERHSAVDAALAAKRYMDVCQHEGSPCFVVQLDITKCFNSMSAHDSLHVLERFGCPKHLVALLGRHYSLCSTRNKLSPVWGGSTYTTVRGIAQGCPLSTILANALLRL
eukprot:5519246-Amphidinium_carterae.1